MRATTMSSCTALLKLMSGEVQPEGAQTVAEAPV